jgi:3D (Asp-Asp-Asp) domain-containing protein/peptidoglycan hydrolase-like protein with peptidoglycan-binding domain
MRFFNGKMKALVMSLILLAMIAAAPITTDAAPTNEMLHKGIHHPDVKPLQHRLKTLDYYHDHIDGVFGSLTYKAVKDFQKDYGLPADGIDGPKTQKALKKVHSLQQAYKHASLLKQGSHGKIVKDLQGQLRDLNYYNGNIDGIYGSVTEKAVKNFQQANHIAVDGIAGPVTFAALIHNPVRGKDEDYNAGKVSDESSSKEVVKGASISPNKSGTADQNAGNKNMSTSGNNTTNKSEEMVQNSGHQSVKTFYVKSTAYTANCPGCSGITATGINLNENPGAKVIAVDPSVIPLGSKVWVEGYGSAIAADTGGAINGRRIDVFVPSRSKALSWGTKTVKVQVFE